MTDVTLSVKEARALIFGALTGAGTAKENARYFTEAILDTELSGLTGHGFYWLQYYCAHVQSGKVNARAKPKVVRKTQAAYMVDARHGFAHPAIERGFEKLVPAARKLGIAAMGVYNSYNAATLGYHTGVLAKQGLVAYGYTNSIPAIAPFGGKVPHIGTNPMSFAVPGRRKGSIAFLIDQSSSAVAWTAVKRASEEGRAIPLGWALDKDGKPTTDPGEGLAGSMAPAGGYKGWCQGLIVEVMCAAVAGGLLGIDHSSFVESDGKPIDNGQFFIAIDPKAFAGGLFHKRIEALCASILSQEGTRLPNSRREENIKRFNKEGLTLEANLYERLAGFAAG